MLGLAGGTNLFWFLGPLVFLAWRRTRGGIIWVVKTLWFFILTQLILQWGKMGRFGNLWCLVPGLKIYNLGFFQQFRLKLPPTLPKRERCAKKVLGMNRGSGRNWSCNAEKWEGSDTFWVLSDLWRLPTTAASSSSHKSFHLVTVCRLSQASWTASIQTLRPHHSKSSMWRMQLGHHW